MRKIVIVLSTGLMTLISQAACGATWYVDGSVPRAGDGTSWEKALKRIQLAINKATHGDTVIVARGTYVENINLDGRNIVLRSTNPTDWAVVKQTIIDGNKAGPVVSFASTENETCVLSGFTVRNGNGTETYFSAEWEIGRGGGGIFGGHVPNLTQATVENNLITGNACVFGGGVFGVSGTIRNNVIVSNSAVLVGGGLALCTGVIENNLILGNSGYCGGGLGHCNATVRNNVVVGNITPFHGGGFSHPGRCPYGIPMVGSITNCIIWGNTSPSGPQVYDSVLPTYCCIQDWIGGGQGNIDLSPQLVDPDGPDDDPNTFEDNDYRLLLTSPCIDAGINEDWMNTATDFDGKPRILVGATSITVDMGAYEYRFDLAIARNTESNVALSWVMRPLKSYTVFSTSDLLLQPWAEETTILGGKTGGPALWVDLDASSALKFYKIEIE